MPVDFAFTLHEVEALGYVDIGVQGGRRDAVRVTTTFTHQQHAELERLAKQHGVKVAWLVRRGAERLIEQANGGALLPLDFGQEGSRHA
jgi:hypothetical protein